jgi:hypothetical protein
MKEAAVKRHDQSARGRGGSVCSLVSDEGGGAGLSRGSCSHWAMSMLMPALLGCVHMTPCCLSRVIASIFCADVLHPVVQFVALICIGLNCACRALRGHP